MFNDVFILVIFTHAEPFSQGLSLFDFNNWGFILSGKTFNDFDVVGVATVLGEDDVFSSDFFVFGFDGFADFVNSFS